MKKYLYVYEYYKNLINSQQLKSGDSLPSIRKAAEIFSVSVTTIQNAYFALQADGYIISADRSGFTVCDFIKREEKSRINQFSSPVKYDLKSGSADRDSFDIKLWHKYIKNALRNEERLFTYSEVKGEQDLREALSDYIREKRNVIASPDRIIIGAGVNNLLSILCPLIKDRKTVSFPDESFISGKALFSDYGFEVHTRDKNADIIYVSPSHMTSYGDVMPVKRRIELIKHSRKQNSLVIEDDFDSDFLYNSKPMPSLHALSGGTNIVYMGSFSNVLTPAIRISFMVLTEELTKRFEENSSRFAQTASKTEQIALCQYIRDGHIKTQTNKVRRLYTAKAKAFLEEIKKQIPNAQAEISENGIQIKMIAPFNKSPEVFEERGINVYIKENKNNRIKLVLSPSALSSDSISDAVYALKYALC